MGRELELLFQVSSSIATAAAFSVFLTAVAFPSMYKRLFMKIVVIISMCDVIASSFSAIGFPNSGSVLCPLQSFFTILGYKSSWLWTTALSYELYSVCIYGKFVPIFYLHLICWSLGLISTLLPLSTNGFGREEQDDGNSWCFINGNTKAGVIWAAVSFQVLLIATSLLTLIFTFRIYWKYRAMNIMQDYPEVYVILDTMILYPLGFFITWGPNLIFSILINFNIVPFNSTNENVFHILTILATQSGTVLAIVFFIKSKEARYRWGKALLVAVLWVLTCGRVSGKGSGGTGRSSTTSDLAHDGTTSSRANAHGPIASSNFTIISSISSSSLLDSDVDAPKDFEDDAVYEQRFLNRIRSQTSSQQQMSPLSSSYSSGPGGIGSESNTEAVTLAVSSNGSTKLLQSKHHSVSTSSGNQPPTFDKDDGATAAAAAAAAATATTGRPRKYSHSWKRSLFSGDAADDTHPNNSRSSHDSRGSRGSHGLGPPRSDGDEMPYMDF